MGHLQTAVLRDSPFGKILGNFHKEKSQLKYNGTMEVFPNFKFPFQTKVKHIFPREANNFLTFDRVSDRTDMTLLKQMNRKQYESRGNQTFEKLQLNPSAFREVDLLYQMLLFLSNI